MGVVANPRGKNTAPFKRFKKNEQNLYYVDWVLGREIGLYWIRNGFITSGRHKLCLDEVLPLRLLGKSLEDYL